MSFVRKSQHHHLLLSRADNATYDLPMLGQDYRLFKSVRKGKRIARRRRELSTASENLYESPYDEVCMYISTLVLMCKYSS